MGQVEIQGGPWFAPGSCSILWHFECRITAIICLPNQNIVVFLFSMLFLFFFFHYCSHDFGPPGSQALGLDPGPTGPVVNCVTAHG